LRTADFDFQLPERLIAQHPPAWRGASRLLRVCGAQLEDRMFADLPILLRENDLLVFNDTRVLKARLFGFKESSTKSRNSLSAKADEKLGGGRVEVLVERLLNEHEVLAQVRASKSPRAGSRLLLGVLPVTVLGREGEFFRLRFDSGEPVAALLEKHGRLPLPPYIAHATGAEDEERYQTVYARQPGAIAAPTAGLHFDEAMLAALQVRGVQQAHVTLHVGAGTFQPVRVENTGDHVMHSECYAIPPATVEAIRAARTCGGRVVAVGTTSLRALESAQMDGELHAGEGETRLFITPGYRFRAVDVLLTNFHLPKSTLLMLACAFGGMNEILAAYRHAVEREYRFFSYGDAMLIERKP
jgi:S-adenosylmethionine:tRNA ribosyltransferase-isomerase